MPLVTDYQHVKEVYREATELGVALPVFCAEDRETLEAILASALEMGKEIGVEDLPIIPAWTVRYHGRPQATLVTACGDPLLGVRLHLSDLDVLMGEEPLSQAARDAPHRSRHSLARRGRADRTGGPRCLCDVRRKRETVRGEYPDHGRDVERVRGKVVVEGAVDEIYDASGAGGMKNEPTTVEQAVRFLRGDRRGYPGAKRGHRAPHDRRSSRLPL